MAFKPKVLETGSKGKLYEDDLGVHGVFKCIKSTLVAINSPSQNLELLPCGDGTDHEDVDRLDTRVPKHRPRGG